MVAWARSVSPALFRKPWIAPSGAPTRGPFFSSRTSGWFAGQADDSQRQPAGRGEGARALIEAAALDQRVRDELFQILGRLPLHARRDFLAEEFEQKVGHGSVNAWLQRPGAQRLRQVRSALRSAAADVSRPHGRDAGLRNFRRGLAARGRRRQAVLWLPSHIGEFAVCLHAQKRRSCRRRRSTSIGGEVRTLVRAVAERLLLGLAARAPDNSSRPPSTSTAMAPCLLQLPWSLNQCPEGANDATG